MRENQVARLKLMLAGLFLISLAEYMGVWGRWVSSVFLAVGIALFLIGLWEDGGR